MSAVVLIPAPFYGDSPTHSHLTLLWAGNETTIGLMENLRRLRRIAGSIAREHHAFEARCGGLTLFGPNRDEPVIFVELTEQIRDMRRQLDDYSASQFPFAPHIAIPKRDRLPNWSELPRSVWFHSIQVWDDPRPASLGPVFRFEAKLRGCA